MCLTEVYKYFFISQNKYREEHLADNSHFRYTCSISGRKCI